MKNNFILLLVLGVVILAGCRSYRGYYFETREELGNVENEQLVSEAMEIFIENDSVKIDRKQTIKYVQNINVSEYDSYIYVESSVAGTVGHIIFYPFTLFFSPLSLWVMHEETKNVYEGHYKYTVARQVWNLFNPLLDYVSTGIEGKESDLVNKYQRQETREKIVPADPCDISLTILARDKNILSGKTPFSLQAVRQLLFDGIFPETQMEITVVAPKTRKSVILKSTDVVAESDKNAWTQIRNTKGTEIIRLKKEFFETLDAWREKRIISEKTYQQEKLRIKLLAEKEVQKEIQAIPVEKIIQNYDKLIAKIDNYRNSDIISSELAQKEKEKLFKQAQNTVAQYLQKEISLLANEDVVRIISHRKNLFAQIDNFILKQIIAEKQSEEVKAKINQQSAKGVLTYFNKKLNQSASNVLSMKNDILSEMKLCERENLLLKQNSADLENKINKLVKQEEDRLSTWLFPLKSKGFVSVNLPGGILSGKSYIYRIYGNVQELIGKERQFLKKSECKEIDDIYGLKFCGISEYIYDNKDNKQYIYYAYVVGDTIYGGDAVAFACKNTIDNASIYEVISHLKRKFNDLVMSEDIKETVYHLTSLPIPRTGNSKLDSGIGLFATFAVGISEIDLPYDYIAKRKVITLSNDTVSIILIPKRIEDGEVVLKTGEALDKANRRIKIFESNYELQAKISQLGLDFGVLKEKDYAEKIAEEYVSDSKEIELYFIDRKILQELKRIELEKLQKQREYERQKAQEVEEQRQKKIDDFFNF